MKNNVLVIGGTGKTGRRVVERLEAQNQNVRIGSRHSTPAFDWEDPESYAVALEGMDRAYIVYSPDLAVPGAREAIAQLTDAAVEKGLEKVVLLSGKGEKEAEACERIVADSGLNHTIVRASWFNQNFSEGAFLDFVLDGTVALPMPEAEIPFVDADDIAEVVAKVLLDDNFNNQTVTVTGPRKLTFEKAVKVMAEGIGRDIHYHPISIERFQEGMKSAGLPDSYIWLFGYLFKEVLGNPENQTLSNDIEKVLGRKAKDFSQYVDDTVKTGIWTSKAE